MTAMQTGGHFAGDARQWFASTILTAAVLEPLYELNLAWIALLAMTPQRWPTGATGSRLPDPVAAGLMSLSPEQRAEMARCPFSLFTARFNDGGYWLGVAGNRQVHEPAPCDHNRADEELTQFTQLALFFAWHLVRANPSSARIVLGMQDQTIAAFASLPLTTLRQLAERPDGLIASRWPNRTWYWLRLVACAGRGEHVAEVGSLGLQMLAADLASSAAANVQSPR
jgi:hypothetical protein